MQCWLLYGKINKQLKNRIMSPEAKATELVKKMNDKIISFENVRLRGEGFEMSKQCSLIAVTELLSVLFQHHEIHYWKEVKAEIEKM